MKHATGTFNVALAPMPVENATDADLIGRRSIDKTFHGALDGTSKGQMLSIGTATPGSAVYVAVERVQATLDEKSGTFSLHHTGIMHRGAPSLTITVVPDSGTEGLAGITGTMSIDIREKQHYYTFEYALP
ncbi:MAG TPA: DUF3224 domain-containing protein [Gemmatimonadaceae bacterium]|jgi:hypothetical protein